MVCNKHSWVVRILLNINDIWTWTETFSVRIDTSTIFFSIRVDLETACSKGMGCLGY
jgi:hypothetical protein